MEKSIIFSLPDNNQLASKLANKLNIELGYVVIREFPDGESYIRIDADVKNKIVILICTLSHPNCKILPLMFMAQTLKELGANKICLVSPYLPYMRQDKRFNPGEASTASLFAKFLSSWIDCLITIDPHLHRVKNLSDIYSIPTLTILHATKKIAEWIHDHIDSPFLVGPDEESSQWISEIAEYAEAPFVICKKVRYGDRKVTVIMPDIKNLGNVPILLDDIISTGTTMIATLQQVLSHGFKNPICMAVHALFDKETEKYLLLTGAKNIVTCNTVTHPSNKIDLSDVIVKGIVESC